jgi:hypothetical protein
VLIPDDGRKAETCSKLEPIREDHGGAQDTHRVVAPVKKQKIVDPSYLILHTERRMCCIPGVYYEDTGFKFD